MAKQKYKKRAPSADLKVVQFHSDELGESFGVVIDKNGFKFFDFPSDYLLEVCRSIAKTPGALASLPGFIGRDFA